VLEGRLQPHQRLVEHRGQPAKFIAGIVDGKALLQSFGGYQAGLLRHPVHRRQRTARKWIEELAIKAPNPDNAVRTLSGGNQQRVVLAKWMATQPKILILDSPTVGVDIAAKDGIYEVVRALAAKGVAILLISDEISEVFYHAHRVLVMRRGRLAGQCIPHASSEEELQAMVDA